MGGAASAEIDRPRTSGEVLPDDGDARSLGGTALSGIEADESKAIEIVGRIPPISYGIVVLLAEGTEPPVVAEHLGISNEKLTELYDHLLVTLGVSTAAEALTTIIELLRSLGHDVHYEPKPALEPQPEPEPPVVERPAWFYRLTTREIEVLIYLCEGKTNQQIADIRVVEIQTIKFHVSNIFRKLGVSNRTAAVSEALKNGFLDEFVDEEPTSPELTIA